MIKVKYDYEKFGGFANEYFQKADELLSEYTRIKAKNNFGTYDEMLRNISDEINEFNKKGYAEMERMQLQSLRSDREIKSLFSDMECHAELAKNYAFEVKVDRTRQSITVINGNKRKARVMQLIARYRELTGI